MKCIFSIKNITGFEQIWQYEQQVIEIREKNDQNRSTTQEWP